jgi:hypothetical protein
MDVKLGINSGGGLLTQLIVRPTFREQILRVQFSDIEGSKIRKKIEAGMETPFRVADDGSLMMGQCLNVLDNMMVKKMIL